MSSIHLRCLTCIAVCHGSPSRTLVPIPATHVWRCIVSLTSPHYPLGPCGLPCKHNAQLAVRQQHFKCFIENIGPCKCFHLFWIWRVIFPMNDSFISHKKESFAMKYVNCSCRSPSQTTILIRHSRSWWRSTFSTKEEFHTVLYFYTERSTHQLTWSI